MFKHGKKLLVNGDFAVPKDDSEERAISALCPLNDLIDTKRVWKPKFANLASFRVVLVPRGHHLVVCKRDARHFFHALRIGRKWQKYMAHPPVDSRLGDAAGLYPLHCSTPMGFTCSAAWAQGYNETVAERCALPPSQRLVAGVPPPKAPPFWGSILDDFWTVEAVADSPADVNAPADSGAEWGRPLLEKVGNLLEQDGIRVNSKKDVWNDDSAEVQGAMLDGRELWIGASRPKRWLLLQAGLDICSRRYVRVRLLQRFVGNVFLTVFRHMHSGSFRRSLSLDSVL